MDYIEEQNQMYEQEYELEMQEREEEMCLQMLQAFIG